MKNYRFLLAAGFLLVLAFTFSCSSDDDKGGSTSACKYKYHDIEVCEETLEEDKKEAKEVCQEDQYGTYYDSCPGDYSKC